MDITYETILEVMSHVLSLSTADQTEVTMLASEDVVTRYTRNRIHQNMEEQNLVLQVRLLEDGRVGSAGTNRLDRESLILMLEKASAMAQLTPPEEEPIGFCSKEELYHPVDKRPLDKVDPRLAAEAIRYVTGLAQETSMNAAGTYAFSQQWLGVGTSRAGVSAAPYREHKLTVLMENHRQGTSGWASGMAERSQDLDVERTADEAVQRASVPLENQEPEPGSYPVILGVDAVADIITTLAVSCFGAGAYHSGSALTSGKIGEELFGNNITLTEDPLDPRGCRMKMDYDGVPRQRVQLIENGVCKGVVYDRETALPLGKDSTGHAQSRPAIYLPGPQANHLFLSAGDHSREDLLKLMGRGLYITRFQYTSVVDPLDLTISGSTRDGTFWVENGQISHALPDLAFQTSILDLLNKVQLLGGKPVLVPGDLGGVYAPELYCDGFRIN